MHDSKTYLEIFNESITLLQASDITLSSFLQRLDDNLPRDRTFYANAVNDVETRMAKNKTDYKLVHHAPFHGLQMGRDCILQTQKHFPDQVYYIRFMGLCGLYHDAAYTRNPGIDEIASAKMLYQLLEPYALQAADKSYLQALINAIIIGGTYPDFKTYSGMITTPANNEKRAREARLKILTQKERQSENSALEKLTSLDALTEMIHNLDLNNMLQPIKDLPASLNIPKELACRTSPDFLRLALLRLTQSVRCFEERTKEKLRKGDYALFIRDEKAFCRQRLNALDMHGATEQSSHYNDWYQYLDFLQQFPVTSQPGDLALLTTLAEFPDTKIQAMKADLINIFEKLCPLPAAKSAWAGEEKDTQEIQPGSPTPKPRASMSQHNASSHPWYKTIFCCFTRSATIKPETQTETALTSPSSGQTTVVDITCQKRSGSISSVTIENKPS